MLVVFLWVGFIFGFVINSCSTYELTQEGGIFIEKQPMSWLMLVPIGIFFVLVTSLGPEIGEKLLHDHSSQKFSVH